MTPQESARRVQELFDAVMDLAPSERTPFLDHACQGETGLRQEVEELLKFFDSSPTKEVLPGLLGDLPGASWVEQRIGPYHIRRELGEGGMGMVYLAEREDVGKRVALKLVRFGRFAAPAQVERFLLERRVLARLEHPNIARLLDAGFTDHGLPYLVMEYVDGMSITQFCDERRLSINDRLILFRQVCSAVHYAHRSLVVHRDLKPSNILVTQDGEVKLLDFGIAKLLGDGDGGEPQLTVAGAAMLTPDYASPEQVRGEPITTASDVYSLGVVLYELLSGHRPYRLSRRSAAEVEQVVCETEPGKPSVAVLSAEEVLRADGETERITPEAVSRARNTQPERLRRRLDGDLDIIVLKALRKEAERRYESAEQLSEDVRRHMVGLPVLARKDTTAYRARKFIRRHLAGVAAAAALVITMIGGIVATASQARRAEFERVVAEQRFQDVRSLASELVFDVHDAIADLPGATRARALLLERALKYLDRLSSQAGDDPVLQQEIAAAYVQLGTVQGTPTGASLGDLTAARQSYGKALSIAQRLVAAHPEDSAARRVLALTHEKIGDAEAWTGDVQQGVEHARRALEHSQYLAHAEPASATYRSSLAIRHVKLGDLLGNPYFPNVADEAGALTQYRRALTLLRELHPDSAKQWAMRRRLGLVHERIGTMLRQDGLNDEALAELTRALAIRETLAHENSANVDALRDVATANQQLCGVQLARGNSNAALDFCRRALEEYRRLRSADSSNVQTITDLARGHRSMHQVLAQRGDINAALAELGKSTSLLQNVMQSYPDNMRARLEYARAMLDASVIHARLAARSGASVQEGDTHWQRSASAYERGQQILLELAGDDGPSREDGRLLRDVQAERARLEASRRRASGTR